MTIIYKLRVYSTTQKICRLAVLTKQARELGAQGDAVADLHASRRSTRPMATRAHFKESAVQESIIYYLKQLFWLIFLTTVISLKSQQNIMYFASSIVWEWLYRRSWILWRTFAKCREQLKQPLDRLVFVSHLCIAFLQYGSYALK